MILSFGGADNKFTSFESAKAVMLPAPYGKTLTYRKGAENGPSAILKASQNLELFDEELGKDIYEIGINTQLPLKLAGVHPEKMVEIVKSKVSSVLKTEKLPVLIGGEHSVTIGAVRAAREKFEDLSVLYFDAHADLRNSYDGSKYNHACVARRLMEIAPVIEAGVRSLSREENDFAVKRNVKIFTALDMIGNADCLNAVKKEMSGNVYISVDLDIFDPSLMPSVGNPEPGGIGWYNFLKAVRSIMQDKKIVGFDVVELSPIKDMVGPDFTAAKLIYKILGYAFP